MTQEPPQNAALCYIDRDTAYFTTGDLDSLRADDWDDAPYEHNASRPYPPRDVDGYEIYVVKFETKHEALVAPQYSHLNSPYSVEDINIGQEVPWLRSPDWHESETNVWAGASYDEFREAIESVRGQVYLPV